MGQLDEEIEEASRGRKIPIMKPDDSAQEKRRRLTEEKFDEVSREKNAIPRYIPGKDEDMSP